MPRPSFPHLAAAALLALLLPASGLAADHKISPTGGLAVGLYATGESNPMGSAKLLVPRVGLQLSERADLELDLAWGNGATRLWARTYNMFVPRINALYHFTPDARFDVFAAGGLGLQHVKVDRTAVEANPGLFNEGLYENPSQDFVANLGPGVTVQLVGPLHLRTDLRWLGSFGGDSTDLHSDVFQNLEWTIGLDLRREVARDPDGDGIANDEDSCPNKPEDFDDFEDEDGCPDEDNDGDGILDVDDKCPKRAEDMDGFQDKNGCPDVDNDEDGIRDKNDKCPDEAEDIDEFEDKDGCPDPDNDGDGVPDAKDQCDGELETDNGYKDGDGCPDEVPKEVKKFTGVIKGITFETNKAVIRRSSESMLNKALKVLKDFPEVRMEVQGHTDSQGDDASNMDLSQRRAEAVVAWFVERGIDASRFVAKGYGETQPIADNKTSPGRSRNRRVEFKLIGQ